MSEGAVSLIVRFHIMSRIEYNKSSSSFYSHSALVKNLS